MSRVAELRRARQVTDPVRFTQTALAARLDISRQMLAAYEKGRYAPSVLIAQDLAHELGVTVEELGFRREAQAS